MSRFYDIKIGDSLHYDGSGPNALQVELNISQAVAGATNAGSSLRVWGIGLDDISQTNNLYGKQVVVRGGMRAGLPLANPSQAGVLGGGMVNRAFGNWVGTDQTLDVIFSGTTPASATGGPDQKTPTSNLVLNWKKGKPLDDALRQALTTAFPGFKINMDIGKFTAPSDQVGFHGNINQFSYYLRRYTQMLGGKGSTGVNLTVLNGAVNVTDGSSSKSGPKIRFEDLVGQPTWIDSNTISVKLVMRGDLNVGNMITLPQTIFTNTAAGGAQPSGQKSLGSKLTFQGSFQIRAINHIGNSRQPGAEAWVTVVEAWTGGGS